MKKLKTIVKKKEFCLFILFVVGVIVHYLLSSFTKSISVAPDELRYVALSKSLFNGGGIAIRGIPSTYQKVAYALFLAPFWAIKDAEIRIQIITFSNTALLMLGMIPLYKICKYVKVPDKAQIIIAMLYIIWPDMSFSMTMMAEILYWPLSLWLTYYWLKTVDDYSLKRGVVLACVSYVTYMCKEIGMGYVLTVVTYEIIKVIKARIKNEKGITRNQVQYLVSFLSCFLLIHILLKMTVFWGMGNSYNQMSIDVLFSLKNIVYMIYGFVYYMCVCLIATFFIPLLMPILSYKKLDSRGQHLCFWMIMNLIIAIGTIVYTITVREDFGDVIPRSHFRYIGPLLILVLVLLYKVQWDLFLKRRHVIVGILSFLLTFCIYRGTDGDIPVDQQILWWTTEVDNWLYVILIEAIVIALITFAIRNKRALEVIIVFLSLFMICDDYIAYNRLESFYSINVKIVDEVKEMNDYFDENNFSILYIASNKAGYGKKVSSMDLFFNQYKNVYFVNDEDLKNLENKNYKLEELVLPAQLYLWSGGGDNKDIKEIEYIIIDSEIVRDGFMPGNIEIENDLSNEDFVVCRNKDKSHLLINN